MTLHLLAAVTTSQPSWLWYATRGLGVTTLIVLTGTVVLGIVTNVRWKGAATPGFVPADLHRNLGLLSVVLLAAHMITTLLDPHAHTTLRDAIVPVESAYRLPWFAL